MFGRNTRRMFSYLGDTSNFSFEKKNLALYLNGWPLAALSLMDFYFKYSTFHVPSPISGGEPEKPFATTWM